MARIEIAPETWVCRTARSAMKIEDRRAFGVARLLDIKLMAVPNGKMVNPERVQCRIEVPVAVSHEEVQSLDLEAVCPWFLLNRCPGFF
jgi:hypothetical protein